VVAVENAFDLSVFTFMRSIILLFHLLIHATRENKNLLWILMSIDSSYSPENHFFVRNYNS